MSNTVTVPTDGGNRRVRRMIVLVSMAFCAMIALAWYVGAHDAPKPAHVAAQTLTTDNPQDWPPCQSEDASDPEDAFCYWDGGANHTGRPFVSWSHGAHGTYLDNNESW